MWHCRIEGTMTHKKSSSSVVDHTDEKSCTRFSVKPHPMRRREDIAEQVKTAEFLWRALQTDLPACIDCIPSECQILS